jgi:serine/threonine protein kinase/dipeptidyl aminopeptidase/acylaminoacyl peptidase
LENREANNAEMTPQQLDRLFDLFLACREMDSDARNLWLREACQGDLSLRSSVERLIREDASAEGFLSRPMSLVTRAFSFVIAEGQRFGRYTITGFVGRGGMGEVWKAHDEELDRAVALKFMSLGFPVNQLTREARMASALNHPGIVTVYDVTLWEGTPILVMELVTGTPLSRFCNGLMPVDQLVSVAAQSASALAAAHAEGIVHGDLKPDNIIWREDRFAKILDFGLARKVANAAPAALAGTPLYMSPEQARGEAAGTASDVYSLGLVLFELATGQRPFGRLSLEEIGARRAKPPKPSGVRHRLPQELDCLIDRMLEPDAAKRITMHEAAEQLLRFERPHALHRVWKVAAVAASLTLAAVLVVWLWFRHPSGQIDFSRMTVRPLASQPGLEDNPSISPDGLWISCLYRARAVDRPQLQVHSMKGGPPVVIETDGLVVQGRAAWSPDSSELAFGELEGSRTHSIYRARRTGGAPTRIGACRQRAGNGCEVDWSPDGATLAVTDLWPGNSELYLLDLASGRHRTLISADGPSLSRPRFSPDGKRIAYLRQGSQVSMTHDDLYVVAAAGGAPRRITRSPWFLKGFAWSTDGNSLVAVSSRLSDKPQIWQFPLDGSEPYRVGELDEGRSTELSLSRRKGSLAWVRDLSVNSLWRMPADRVPADQSSQPPGPLVNSAAVDIDAEWSSNGRMVFRSDRSGVNELWIAQADGSGPWQATRFRGPFVGDPHWSPDGRAIAFTAHVDGNPDIFVMRCDQDITTCGEPRQLTRTPATDANPTWSADGRWIYFSSSRSDSYEVWRTQADGGAGPERITWNGGYMARESADGKWLYYSKVSQPVGFWRIALPARGPGQSETPIVLNAPYKTGATWALGARELFYYPSIEDPAVPFPAVRALDLETGRTRDLPVGNVRLGRGLSLSPDGRWLLRSQNDRAQTLIMIAE